MAEGVRALFTSKVESLRDVRADQYGIRTLLEYDGQPRKFEIVREGRLDFERREAAVEAVA